MTKTKRNRYPAEFKAKVALETLKGEKTIHELASQYGVHPNMIAYWKRQAVENMTSVFTKPADTKPDDKMIKELHAKIGQLTVERDFLARAFGR